MTTRRLVLSDATGVTAHPAATVVLLRDAPEGCEVLLVRRNAQLSFHGGAWVFPGGRIDAADYAGLGESSDIIAAARQAAVREAQEEAGVEIAAQSLVPFARWITPEGLPKRFDAWFFVAPASSDMVRVDGGEIHEHRWMRPADALAAQRSGSIELPPPTWVTLHGLSTHPSTSTVLRTLAQAPLEEFLPRLYVVADGACSLYEGDVAYDTGEVDAPGPRHRLWMLESGWRYERHA